MKRLNRGIDKDFSGCTLIMGSPGTGKSTLAAIIARHALRAGQTVWSTEPIVGTLKLDIRNDPHSWDIQNGWVLIDEAGISMGNRDWKGFTTKQIEFFKLYRHYHLRIVILSQDKDDADKKARQLATKIYLMQKTLVPFCVRYDKFRIFVGPSDDQTDIVRKYEPISWWMGGIKYRFRHPQIWKMFDSYCGKSLPPKDWETWGVQKIDGESLSTIATGVNAPTVPEETSTNDVLSMSASNALATKRKEDFLRGFVMNVLASFPKMSNRSRSNAEHADTVDSPISLNDG